MTSTTAADLQAAFDYLKKCISVERESVWQLAKSDPIAALLLDLENSENNIPSCDAACCCYSRASCSSAACASSQYFDVRIQYGHKITSVLRKIALLLGTLENVEDVKASLVSTKDMALLSSAFQFFILTCISPYLDKGVGVPLNLRSHLIQSWEQCSGDLEFRSSELFRAAECIVELLNCNEAVQGELLTKYSPDIFCVFEQLAYFGRNDFTEEFEKILSSMHPHLLVSTLLGLVKPRTGAQPTPSWFSFSIGSRLSAVLLGKNGLEITLSSYESISGEQMWQNTHLLFVLGKQFALPPRKVTKIAYYKNITAQFIQLLKKEKFSRGSLAYLFLVFVIEMKKKSALAYGVLIDDVLFRPWELLNQSSNPCWTENHTTSLCLMKLWSNEKLGTEVLKDNPRFTSIAPVLLSLLPIPVMSTTSEVRNLKKDIYDVLKFSLEKIENLSDLLLAFICDSSMSYQVSQDQPLVKVIGEESDVYGKVSLCRLQLNKEETLGRKIDAVISLIKSMDQLIATRLCTEIACKCVKMWDDCVECNLSPRFVNTRSNNESDIEFARLSSHLVAGVFFEQIIDGDNTFSDPSVIVSLLDLVQSVLQSTVRYLRKRYQNNLFDVTVPAGEQEQQLSSTISQNAKMAVGLAGAVIIAASMDEKTSAALSEVQNALITFVDCVHELCNDNADFTATAEDAHQLCSIFGKEASAKPSVVAHVEQKKSALNVIDSIREGISDECPAARGRALLEAAQLIRLRNADVLFELDKGIFDLIKASTADHDSYVYLAAINALAEAACYSSTYLRELISMFKNYDGSIAFSNEQAANSESQDPPDDESDKTVTVNHEIIVRSRICEVLGKVFKVLGDMSPVWMDESAGIFLKCLTETDEIIRAGSLSSLSELILACHGKNIEKYLDEIFYAVKSIIGSDPSPLVRRSAVNLIRQVIKSCDTALVEVIGGRLRDLHRELLRLWRWDPDHVVRLHAELAIEELRAVMKSMILEETKCPRQIVL